jgi:uncharacterized sporulation protein YeaH/YhbH (DUF444 family)
MSSSDWTKANTRARMQRQGVEGAADVDDFMQPLVKRRQSLVRRKPSKAEMRAEAQAAVDVWTSKPRLTRANR